MQQADRWTPSKYVMRRGRLSASHDTAELGVGSRLVAGAVAARYAEHLPRFARGRLVDLGCGKVPLYGAYRALVESVTCVDWPGSAHGARHIDRSADLNEPLPFADAAFDTVVLSDVLEHLPRPERLWAEMARILAPGGHVLLNVPFLYGIHEAPHDYARHTGFGLRRLAADAGFQVMHLEAVGGSAHVFADLLAKHLAQLPGIGRWAAAAVQAPVAALDRTRAGQRFAARSAERFPLGYFMVARRP